ncbi:MAG: hypothetical protein KH749_09030 [Parabacteroides johnsonii]|nr:hypothetical protein [Parabacteroides johnsonii]
MQTIIKTYNMELTLKDRVLILNTVLPQFDTRKNMELKVSIDSKIAISEVDQKRIVIKDMGSGQINIGFTDAAAITETTDIVLTDEELQYLKQRVDFIDRNGMFSEFTMPTYVKILDEPLKEEQPGE